jgi:predicted nucleotidyltransferase/HEPN domain-containing protein
MIKDIEKTLTFEKSIIKYRFAKMKKSIKHLPKRTQEELAILQELILEHISNVRMIILFGSYARGSYSLYKNRDDFGVPSSFQSDIDILVVSETGKPEALERFASSTVIPLYFERLSNKKHPTPPEILVESWGQLARMIRKQQYFFSDIIKEGILLYDDEKVVFPKPEELNYRERYQIAKEEYEGCYILGEGFLDTGIYCLSKEQYKLGSFQLHQACERFYKSIFLVYDNYRPQTHNLKSLYVRSKNYSQELASVFPQNTNEEIRLFNKLCRAYIESRYNFRFQVDETEFDFMLTRTKTLHDVVGQLCEARLAFYKEKAEAEEKEGIV